MRLTVLVTALAFLAPAAAVAHADMFTITGQGQDITFSLPNSPTPSSYYTGEGFNISGVDVDIDGVESVQDVGFATDFAGGAVVIGLHNTFSDNQISCALCYILGASRVPQFYSGTESDPTFILGSTTFIAISNLLPIGDYDLTIAPDVAATPEPSSIALLGSGVIGIAGLVRRRFIA